MAPLLFLGFSAVVMLIFRGQVRRASWTELSMKRWRGNTCNAAIITTKKPVHPGFCWIKQLDCNGHWFIWHGWGKGYKDKLNSGILGEGRSITLEVEERRLPGFLTLFFHICVCSCACRHECACAFMPWNVSKEGRRQLTGVSLLPLAHMCAFIRGCFFWVSQGHNHCGFFWVPAQRGLKRKNKLEWRWEIRSKEAGSEKWTAARQWGRRNEDSSSRPCALQNEVATGMHKMIQSPKSPACGQQLTFSEHLP